MSDKKKRKQEAERQRQKQEQKATLAILFMGLFFLLAGILILRFRPDGGKVWNFVRMASFGLSVIFNTFYIVKTRAGRKA